MIKYITAIIVFLTILLGLFLLNSEDRIVVYDCSIIEWHPDVPREVKEECRKRILDYIKNEKRNYI